MSEDRTPGSAVSPDPAEAPPTGRDPEATAALSAAAGPPAGGGFGRPAEPTRPAPARPTLPAPGSSSAAPPGAPGGAPTTVLPGGQGRPNRPTPPRVERAEARPAPARPQSRPAGRRRARLVLQRLDPWSVFLFSLVASICLGVVLLVAVASLYAVLSSLGVLSSLNGVLGEVAGSGTPDEVVEPFITAGRVLGAAAVLAAVDVVLLTALATLGALLYNLCASLTGGIEVQLGERD